MTTMALRTALSVFLVLMIACETGTVSSPVAHNAEPVDGARLWSRNCATCHGTFGAGDGPLAAGNGAPSLTSPDATERLTETVIEAMIRNGRGGMPAFRHLNDAEVQALVAHVRHLMTPSAVQPVAPPTSGPGTPSPAGADVTAPDPAPSRTPQGPP